jgi:hypothetical protein
MEKALNLSDQHLVIGQLRLMQPINHPGRIQYFQYIDYHRIAATPPSKGGETFSNLRLYNTTIRFTAMPSSPFAFA